MNIRKITLFLLGICLVLPQVGMLSATLPEELADLNATLQDSSVNPFEALQNSLDTLLAEDISTEDVNPHVCADATTIYNKMDQIMKACKQNCSNNPDALQDYADMLHLAKQYANRVFNPLQLVSHNHRDAAKSAARINTELTWHTKQLEILKRKQSQAMQPTERYNWHEAQADANKNNRAQQAPAPAQEGFSLSSYIMPGLFALGLLGLHEWRAHSSGNGNSIFAFLRNTLENMFGQNNNTQDTSTQTTSSAPAATQPPVSQSTSVQNNPTSSVPSIVPSVNPMAAQPAAPHSTGQTSTASSSATYSESASDNGAGLGINWSSLNSNEAQSSTHPIDSLYSDIKPTDLLEQSEPVTQDSNSDTELFHSVVEFDDAQSTASENESNDIFKSVESENSQSFYSAEENSQ